MTFKELHYQKQPLLLGNVWDAKSAKIMEGAGFKALGTSSAAISHMLGYEDGEQLSFEELEYVVKRIFSVISLPLSVDIESGYSRDTGEIIDNIEKMHDLGVVGINLEDSIVETDRKLIPRDEFGIRLKSIKDHFERRNKELFINARTDSFILDVPNKLKETINRMLAYEEAGADGIFVPFIQHESEIIQVTNSTKLPVNVVCVPGLTSVERLASWGVKRISIGNFMHDAMCNDLRHLVGKVIDEQSYDIAFQS